MVDSKYTLYKCIQIIGEYPSPFPFLAVKVLDNTVMVVHGIQHLTVPFLKMITCTKENPLLSPMIFNKKPLQEF